VNCVEWHPEDSLLYSGSDDSYIVEWDLQTSKTRWWVPSLSVFVEISHSKWSKFRRYFSAIVYGLAVTPF
jgi:WD40 repeat protein